MSPFVMSLIGLGIVLLLLFLGMPIGLSMALVGFFGFSYLSSTSGAVYVVQSQIFETVKNYTFTVIPLFVLMGSIAANSGMAGRLYQTANKWLGHFPGGLAIATIAGAAGFSAICGSSLATSSTLAKVAIPEMERYNYKPEISAGCAAAGGTLGILIPPSLAFILYSVMTQVSVGRLFVAGVLPGITLAILYMVVVLVWAKADPKLAPPAASTPLKERLKSLPGAIDAVIIFLLVMGGIFAGIFTPTEGASAGVAAIILIALIRRDLTWRGFLTSLSETAMTSAMIILIVVGAMILNRFLAISQLPYDLARLIAGLPLSRIYIMLAILASYFVLGCIMDTAAMILLTVPIYFPLITSLGYDPVWFGVIVIVMMEIGGITPPVGMNVYVISGMFKHIPMQSIFKGAFVLLIGNLVLVAILLAFPALALFLPSLMK